MFLECFGTITEVKTASFLWKLRYNLALFCFVGKTGVSLPWERKALDAPAIALSANISLAYIQHKFLVCIVRVHPSFALVCRL